MPTFPAVSGEVPLGRSCLGLAFPASQGRRQFLTRMHCSQLADQDWQGAPSAWISGHFGSRTSSTIEEHHLLHRVPQGLRRCARGRRTACRWSASSFTLTASSPCALPIRPGAPAPTRRPAAECPEPQARELDSARSSRAWPAAQRPPSALRQKAGFGNPARSRQPVRLADDPRSLPSADAGQRHPLRCWPRRPLAAARSRAARLRPLQQDEAPQQDHRAVEALLKPVGWRRNESISPRRPTVPGRAARCRDARRAPLVGRRCCLQETVPSLAGALRPAGSLAERTALAAMFRPQPSIATTNSVVEGQGQRSPALVPERRPLADAGEAGGQRVPRLHGVEAPRRSAWAIPFPSTPAASLPETDAVAGPDSARGRRTNSGEYGAVPLITAAPRSPRDSPGAQQRSPVRPPLPVPAPGSRLFRKIHTRSRRRTRPHPMQSLETWLHPVRSRRCRSTRPPSAGRPAAPVHAHASLLAFLQSGATARRSAERRVQEQTSSPGGTISSQRHGPRSGQGARATKCAWTASASASPSRWRPWPRSLDEGGGAAQGSAPAPSGQQDPRRGT